jgi:hypothetical protein
MSTFVECDSSGLLSGVWVPPPEYRNNKACKEKAYTNADMCPVHDRRGISMRNDIRPRIDLVQKVRTVGRNFSLDQALPQVTGGIETEIDCDDPRDDLKKNKLHCVRH